MPEVRVLTKNDGVWRVPDIYSVLVAAPCHLNTRPLSMHGDWDTVWLLTGIDWDNTTVVLEEDSMNLRVEFIQ